MEIYILKSVGCLAILFAFYKAVLERESFHNIKRFYLLGSLAVAFLIPLITFTQYVELTEPTLTFISTEGPLIITEQRVPNVPFSLISIWAIYGAGLLFFGLKFFRNLFRLAAKIKQNPNVRNKNLFHVLLKTPTVPHTFLQYIFLNKTKFENKEIPAEVLLHEEAHAVQKHSLDILLIELLQVIFWFNPLLYFMKHSIKLNHEFLADKAVLKQGVETSHYQNILLAFSSSAITPTLANSINYSFIKKRFTVMKNQTSKKSFWLKTLLIMPLISLLLYSFSSRKIIQQNSNEDNTIEVFNSEVDQTNATRDEMREYNALAKKYNEADGENLFIRKNDVDRLTFIHNKMSSKQREDAEPFPNFPPPPPAPDTLAPPKVIIGVNDGDPGMPPPPPPKPIKVVLGVNDLENDIPPPPPKNPLDHIISMSKKGASFYYEGEKVNSDKAIKLIKKNNSLNIQTTQVNSKNPQVRISKKPIVFDSNNQTAAMKQQATTDAVTLIKKLASEGAHFLLFDGGPHFKDGQKITSERAIEIANKVNGLTINVKDAGYIYKIVELRLEGC